LFVSRDIRPCGAIAGDLGLQEFRCKSEPFTGYLSQAVRGGTRKAGSRSTNRTVHADRSTMKTSLINFPPALPEAIDILLDRALADGKVVHAAEAHDDRQGIPPAISVKDTHISAPWKSPGYTETGVRCRRYARRPYYSELLELLGLSTLAVKL
jgi:hypothetical protein